MMLRAEGDDNVLQGFRKLMFGSTMVRHKKFYLRTLFADLRCENCKKDGRNTEEQKDLVLSPYYFTPINFFCCSTSLESLQAKLDCDRKKDVSQLVSNYSVIFYHLTTALSDLHPHPHTRSLILLLT